jgi:hypothetical protein
MHLVDYKVRWSTLADAVEFKRFLDEKNKG